MITVISHFYNEEFLLPFWLKHHLNLFDHGILINYRSTDRSTEIIKELCPTWEIRATTNKGWNDPFAIDNEVMAIENSISGWKIALNTTEFVFHYDLQEYTKNFKGDAVRTQGFYMFDPPELINQDVDQNQYLVLQRTYGCKESDNQSRSRLLHRYPNGNYLVGRHRTRWDAPIDNSLYLLWYNWSPYKQNKQRGMSYRKRHYEDLVQSGQKGAMVDQIRELSTSKGWDKEHQVWREGKNSLSAGIDGPPRDLLSDDRFKFVHEKFKKFL